MSTKQVDSVDEYLNGVPEEARAALERLRGAIRAAAPEAIETISYRVPTYSHHGPLVGFAAFKNHLSFFVMSTAVMDAHGEQLELYDTAKGTIRFQADRPIPAALVKKLVKARVAENEARASGREPLPTRRKEAQGMTGKEPRLKRPRYPMPEYIKRELEEAGLMEAYGQRPPYQQNDYIGWITRAKQEATRQRRLAQMLEELKRGDVYMKMAYTPKRRSRTAGGEKPGRPEH